MPFGQGMMGGGAALGGMMGGMKPQMQQGMRKQKMGGMNRPQMGQGIGPSRGMMGGMMQNRAMQNKQQAAGRGGAMGPQMAQGFGMQQMQPQQPAINPAQYDPGQVGQSNLMADQQSFGGGGEQSFGGGIAPQPDMLRNMMDRKRQAQMQMPRQDMGVVY